MDAGGGDSLLADHLLQLGYSDITVLDISETAIDKAKVSMGETASKIKWITADVTTFVPQRKYDLWHDRAVFHFLQGKAEVERYIDIVKGSILNNGYLIIGTFSEKGPDKCSGLPVTKYSENSLCSLFENDFTKLNCFTIDHLAPSNKIQNFLFCSFRKK